VLLLLIALIDLLATLPLFSSYFPFLAGGGLPLSCPSLLYHEINGMLARFISSFSCECPHFLFSFFPPCSPLYQLVSPKLFSTRWLALLPPFYLFASATIKILRILPLKEILSYSGLLFFCRFLVFFLSFFSSFVLV